MPLSRTQRKLIDSILEHGPQSVKALASSTGLSQSQLRKDIEILGPQLTTDKERIPYLIDVAPNSPELLLRNEVEAAKACLTGVRTTQNAFMNTLLTIPKEMWVDHAKTLRAIVLAIDELEADGKLIDTL